MVLLCQWVAMAWCVSMITASAINHADFHESVGILFTNHERVIQKQLGSDILTIIIKIPDFHNIDTDTNFSTQQVSCPTFHPFQNECTNAIEALDIELERRTQQRSEQNEALLIKSDLF